MFLGCHQNLFKVVLKKMENFILVQRLCKTEERIHRNTRVENPGGGEGMGCFSKNSWKGVHDVVKMFRGALFLCCILLFHFY